MPSHVEVAHGHRDIVFVWSRRGLGGKRPVSVAQQRCHNVVARDGEIGDAVPIKIGHHESDVRSAGRGRGLEGEGPSPMPNSTETVWSE